jgi:adenosylcobinamide kinase/adenosylcobinamide-phosphate guanylyltransferase
LAEADPSHTVVLDCLTLWTANALARDGDPQPVLASATRAAGIASAREALTVVVSNEVGLGIVPVVAGRALPLARAGELASP